jgi:translocation and assembly module TamA
MHPHSARRASPSCFPARPLLLATGLAAWLAAGAAAQAAIRVDIEGVDAELRRNVQAMLSLERYKDRERIEADAIERLYRRVPAEVEDALRPYGYYEPKVTSRIDPEDKGRNWRVRITIEPGEPVLLGEAHVELQGPGADDPLFARVKAAQGLQVGEPLRHADYERLKSELQATAGNYGYLDARLLRAELQVDTAQHRAVAWLVLETGQRYHFGATTIEQQAVRPALIDRYLRYQQGEPYDASKLLRTQFALDDSQFYSTVELTTGQRDPQALTVPVLIRGARARNTYSIGPGYGTDTGARITLGALIPRVNDRGHRLRILARVSETAQQFNVRYDMPFGDPVLEKLSLQVLTDEQNRSGGVDTRQVAFRPSITQSLGRWQRVGFVSFERDTTYTLDLPPAHEDMIVPGATFARVPEGYLGEELFSRSLYFEVLGSSHGLGSKSSFLRADLRSEGVIDLSERWHLLLRGEAGAAAVKDYDELPATYRFFAGGDRSVRGFSLDGLAPLQCYVPTSATGVVPVTYVAAKCGPDASFAKERAGGHYLLAGTVEIERDLPKSLGVAAFFDAGNAFDRIGDPLALSFGIGLRWRLPVVTVGLDVAKPLHAPGYADLPGPRLHLNISPKL